MLKKLFKSFGYAFKGLAYACRTQLNMRVHLALTILALFLGWYLAVSLNEWLWIALCIALVLSAELLNTAIENLTDLVSPGYNEKAGRVKDLAAAAVVITAAFALLAACIIFIPKLIAMFK